MKQKKGNIVRRFAVLIFSIITLLGFFFILITYTALTHYHEAGMQLLNKDVAAHIAKFSSPFEGDRIDKEKADSVFYNAMVLSPSAEVYFLDNTGKVIAFHADSVSIAAWQVPLKPLQKYISAKGEKYIKGIDPRDPLHKKIFSTAEVFRRNDRVGYIYVILDGKRSEGIMELLLGNHILSLAVTAFLLVIVLSVLFSLLYLKRISKNYSRMLSVLVRFESGDYTARFNMKKNHEMEPITGAFNRMADLLSSSISRLTESEQERKNFIATISHDLRTPLSIARGYTETLAGTIVTGDNKNNYAALIHTKLLQIENMVQQLFELSKMDAVEFQPHIEPFVLSEIVQEGVNNFQQIALEKRIKLNCTKCLYHVWVNADVSMMERVVQNLLENALKGTPEGGTVNAWLEVENNFLVFNIQNSGDPLFAGLVDWINRSVSGISMLSGKPSNLGLGLMIVQKILHLHNSSLKARTENGDNFFSFSLPVFEKSQS